MSTALVVALVVVVIGGLPPLLDARSRAAPRVAASAYLVSLIGWGLLPVVWLVCLGSGLGSWIGGVGAVGGCHVADGVRPWSVVGYAPGAAVVGVLGFHLVRQVRLVRRTEFPAGLLSVSVRRPTRAGDVWVLPSRRPAAFVSGVWRCRAVVTSGLLGRLSQGEREAVCEHEVAHLRLGHPRLLVVAGAVAAAYGWFPPVSRAWRGLRRQLEAAADDEAGRVVGSEVLRSALVRVAELSRSDGSSISLSDQSDLGWRLARLERREASPRWPSVLVGAGAAAVVVGLTLGGCLLAGVPSSAIGLLGCLVVVVPLGVRPGWAAGHVGSSG